MPLHDAQILEFRFYIDQLVLSHIPRLAATLTVIELEQSAHFFQREAELLRALDEAQPGYVAVIVMADAARRLWRHFQQRLPLVITDGFDMNRHARRNLADGKEVTDHCRLTP